MVWAAGHNLKGGQYVIQRELGKGGCGITYLAKDTKGNQVVIKTLKDEVLTNPNLAKYQDKFRRNFERETLWLALCRHPHIVQVKTHFYEGLFPCMVMEYVEGQDLWSWVEKQGTLSEAEALRYIHQISSALAHIHGEQGILHRDVKPQNIMLRKGKSETVLIDFGIAREFIPDITQYQTEAHTHGFSPIEQYTSEARRGEYTDVYALAATLYYLLTGKVPTPAFRRAINYRLKPPIQQNPHISDEVNDAILKGMALEPENRPQSVQDWLKLLQGSDVAPTIPSSSPDMLSSAVGIDYRELQHLLAAGKWAEADRLTLFAIRLASRREKEGWLRLEDIETLPCQDLCIIDQLWTKYSNGHFGFSIQNYIWEAIEEQLDKTIEWRANLEVLRRVIWRWFSASVGWLEIDNDGWLSMDLSFEISSALGLEAPIGHFPALSFLFLVVLGEGGSKLIEEGLRDEYAKHLFARVETCCKPTHLEPVKYTTSGVSPLLSKISNLFSAVAVSPQSAATLPIELEKPQPKIWKCVQTFSAHSDSVTCIAISPDGKLLTSGSRNGVINLWDLKRRRLIHVLEGHTDEVTSIAISPNGELLASGGEDEVIKIWRLSTGELLQTLKQELSVGSVAFSHDGQILASGGFRQINLWNPNTGKLSCTFKGHSYVVTAVAFSPDGHTLASSSSSYGENTINIWHLREGRLLRKFTKQQQQSGFQSIKISPDGQTLAGSSGWGRTITLWDFVTGELLHTLCGHSDWVNSIAISPDGQNLASGSGDKTIKIWHLGTGKLIHTLEEHSKGITCVLFSLDRETLISGSHDGTIKIWQAFY